MKKILLEVTNQCNRSCRHCFRNQADPPGLLTLEIAEDILAQAEPLGFKEVCLTGGEVAFHPEHLGKLLRLIAARGFNFNLVTNGFQFRKEVLPLLLESEVRERLMFVCFSLDGAKAETHDGLRGSQSFWEVMDGLTQCRKHKIPTALKSVVTALNQGELTEIALLGAKMGIFSHDFIYPMPTPRLIREGLLLSGAKINNIMRWVKNDLACAVRTRIFTDGYFGDHIFLNCGNLVESLDVDYQGNHIFCCALSHITMGDGKPTTLGRELVADLKEVSLKEAIVGQFRLAAELMEAKLTDPGGLSETPCLWCLKYFGKLEWLKDFPGSPWTTEVLGWV